MEQHTLTSASGEYTRTLWLLNDEAVTASRLCVFLDAEYYLHKIDAPAILHDLRKDEAIPPVTCVFVSHVDQLARHHDYTCNPRYSDFIANDVLTWAGNRNSQLSQSNMVICGLSLSGLAAAYLTLSYPDKFTTAICQSGSFWWNEEWMRKHLNEFPRPRRFWISAGDKEDASDLAHAPTGLHQAISQMTGCERIVEALKGHGHTVNYHFFSGGHSMEPWKKELPDALTWALNGDSIV